MHSKSLFLFIFISLWFGAVTGAHALLPIETWQTTSGARVYFVANRSLPMLDVSVEFPAGAGYDVPAKSGVASMANRVLQLGATGLTEEVIADRLADVGAILSGRFDADRAGLGLRTLSGKAERDASLAIMAQLLAAPTFPQAVLEREKVRLVGSLREADIRPDTIAARTFYPLVYGGHPYGLRSSGEVETVQRITREDLVEFHRRRYLADQAVVAIMGDASRADAGAIAEALTRDLPRAAGAAPAIAAVPALAAPTSRFVPHPAAQSHILVGAPGLSRDDPDYFPLYVGNYILGGGGFVSRIMDEVRQKRGLAYSAYSAFSPLQQRGAFVIGMQTQRDQAFAALEVVRDTLRNFVANGPTEQELTAAKQNIVGGFPLQIDSNRKIHGYLAMIGFYRLPLTYLDAFTGRVERVTAAEIRDAFRRRIDPATMVTVVVGVDADKAAAAR